jgi:catecholate siderophore receptor
MKIKKREKKNRKRLPPCGPKYWVAMSTLAAYITLGNKTGNVAYAQETHGPGKDSVASQTLSVRRFDIPPGPLGSVLDSFQSTTGLQVVVPNEAMRTLSSPGVSGLYSVELALKQLLAGTGVSYRFTASERLTLEFQSLKSTVEVTERISPLSSLKSPEPLLDTPQSITIIPKTMIEQQGATTLREVLRNVSGLTMTAGEGGTPAGDNLTLRGFSARNDVFIDGVRDLGPQSRDPFDVEQVEVIKGPGSAFSGRGSTGGTINLVSKSPNLTRFVDATFMLGTDGTKRVTADLNLPVKPLGEHTAFRLNFMAHDSGVAGRDVVNNQRWGVAPSLAFGLSTPTRLTLSYFKLKQDNISDYGIPWVPATNNVLKAYRDRPAPVPRNTFYGLQDRDHEKLDSDLATIKLEHDFGDSMTLRNQFRYGRSSRDSMATPPRFASDNTTVINREMRSWITEDGIWDNQTDFRINFSTGPVTHAVVTGIELSRENNIRQIRTAANMPTTLLNPNPNDTFTGPITMSPYVGDITGNTVALYVFDTVKLSQRWEATGGVRWERFDVDGVSTTPAPVSRVDQMPAVRGALIFKPKPNSSLYASYGTSFDPSLEGLSYNTANTAIEPEKTYTTEFGAKWDLFGERLALTGALFRIDKTNARTPGILPDDPPQVLQGSQRVNGAELGVSGSIARQWQIFGGYTLLDSDVLKSNVPAEMGRAILNVPRNSFNIWTTYQFKKLTLGGGPRFVGRRFGNTINTRQVDSYWTMDAMASYSVTRFFELRLNAYNLSNEYYFGALSGGHIVPGPGRALMLSTAFRF